MICPPARLAVCLSTSTRIGSITLERGIVYGVGSAHIGQPIPDGDGKVEHKREEIDIRESKG
jgi:hypothetical protein